MDEITIGDKTYVSSKRAAAITGYAKDYVGQLCREGRVEARLVGRNWYVLESAIREHRFGEEKVEETKPEAPAAAPIQADRAATWEKPRYVAETPAYVPELASKPVETAPSAPVIADMQSAWKEWFEEKRPQASLPDGSDDFKPEFLPVVMDTPEATVPDEVVEEAASRMSSTEYVPEVQDAAETEEETVSLHRSYESRQTGERIPTTSVPIVDLTHTVAASTPVRAGTQSEGGEWNAVIRSLSFVVALIAVLIAIVGTGNGDRIFAGTSLNFGAQKAVLDYLGGTSTYENSL